jgi:DNA polymerase-3 subunit beta
MKIIANTKELQTAFKNLLKVAIASNKTKIVALTSIKLDVTEEYAELTATDNAVTVTVKLKDVEIVETGSMVITRDTLKLVSKLTDNSMIITEREIISGKRNVKYSGLDPTTYPNKPYNNYCNHAFTLSKVKMFDIQSITYACSDSETTPILQRVNIRGTTATATDRHRLAQKTLDNNEYTKDLNIPAYALNYIPTFTDKKFNGEYILKVDSNERYVQIKFDNVTMDIQLIDGNYPDVSRIIPQSFQTEATVNKSEIIEELKVLKEVVIDKTKLITIEVTAGKMSLKARSSSNMLTSELDSIVTGEDISLHVNLEFILDALSTSAADNVTFKFTGRLSPLMINNEALILPYSKHNYSAA